MKRLLLFLTCSVFTWVNAQDINLELFGSGFSSPVNVKHAGDDRLFVVERAGYIKILNSDGSVNTTNFLNIDGRVTNNGGEQGLLAMAFHPNYSTNGFFYVNYINNSGDTVISRFTRLSAGVADPNSEVILMTISQPFSNHNGGDMHFSPNDGYLYISTGDGGSGGDPGNRAQNLNLLLGKMLRIDVDGTSNGNYGIPASNPFVGNPSALDEIWAYGLRNPWKFSFDRSNGDMWIADVGQSSREEINRVPASSAGGENYGWKCFEGNTVFSSMTECNTITHQPPVAEYVYGGSPFRCSITGGYIYRGTIQTGLQGRFFFADFCSDEIGVVTETSPNNYSLSFLDQFTNEGFSAFAEDVNGELYAVGLISGNIYRIEDANLSVDESSLQNIKMYPNPANNYVTIDLIGNNSTLSEIRFYDVLGKQVYTSSDFNDELVTIPLDGFQSGLYIVELLDNRGKNSIRKLIVD